MQFLAKYTYAPTVSVTFSYDCAPFYKAVHDPMIALKIMRRKRAMCLSLVITWWENIRQLPISEHIWEHSWSWKFSPTRCLFFAYTVPTRGSSFIFGFWPCKLRGLRLCRKGNEIIPFLIKMQCWRRSANAIYFPYVGSRSKRSKQGSGSSRSK